MMSCMAAILNNFAYILSHFQGFTSGTHRILTQRLHIMTRNHIKKRLCHKTREMCLPMTSWRPFWIICIFWKVLKVSRLEPSGIGISTSILYMCTFILSKSHQKRYLCRKIEMLFRLLRHGGHFEWFAHFEKVQGFMSGRPPDSDSAPPCWQELMKKNIHMYWFQT